MKKRFKIVTLGCRTNQYESQAYVDQLEALGYVPAGDGETADVCIVNTCTVTQAADSDSDRAVRRLASENPEAKIVVTGCSAEQRPKEMAALPGVSLVVPNAEKEILIEKLFPEQNLPEFSIKKFEAHTRAFVKVQDGCNSFCTYCLIPYVRGRSRSRTVGDVVKEVEGLIKNGYREVVLTGINIGDFDGASQPARLSDLVRAVDQIEGLERLRLSSIDPDEVDASLTEALLNGKTTCPSLHLVLQSGSDAILKRMNRKYTRQIFLETAKRLVALRPDFTFTTDIIVGFPGETERDFEDTLGLMEEVCFVKVHMFPYSVRPRTRAALYDGKVAPEVIRERKSRLLRKGEEVAFRERQNYVGKEMEVLVEGGDDKRCLQGHTANFLPVLLAKDSCKQNDLVTVRMTLNTPAGLVGEVLSCR